MLIVKLYSAEFIKYETSSFPALRSHSSFPEAYTRTYCSMERKISTDDNADNVSVWKQQDLNEQVVLRCAYIMLVHF